MSPKSSLILNFRLFKSIQVQNNNDITVEYDLSMKNPNNGMNRVITYTLLGTFISLTIFFF